MTALPQEPALTTVEVNGKSYPSSAAMARLVQVFNVNGHPVLSAPCGFSSEDQPVGFQLVGRLFEDGLVLGTTRVY
jgi:aspartyl-tRNA(Asn)/glutamyl-tRNA(Gln) amidotransferase subunit A